jgi:phosphotransferase family enzyme
MNALVTVPQLESWRLLVVQPERAEILLHTDGVTFSLPEIAISPQERIAANINREVERRFGLRVISLYEIHPDSPALPDGVVYHAALSVGSLEPIPTNTIWMSIGSLSADSFRHPEDFAAIGRFHSLCAKANADWTAEPFLRLTWFAEVTDWVNESLRSYQLRLTGPFQQLNACSTFSLLRFETSGRPVWFKAVGAPNTREYPITMALARICPEFIPKVLATRRDWNAWVAEEAAGTSLVSDEHLPHWESAAKSLADLQMQTIPFARELSRAGARDFSCHYLGSCVNPFIEFLQNDARGPSASRVPHLPVPELCELRVALQDVLATLDELALPQTVGHMDLNPHNIICSDRKCVFLDWAEAFIGCPLFSFEYLLQQFRRAFPSQPAMERMFREAYVARWRASIAPASLALVASLSPLAALFTYATMLWRYLETDESPNSLQWEYFRRLVRKMRHMSQEREGVAR